MALRSRIVLKRLLIGAGVLAALFLIVGAGGALWLRGQLRASLPILDGEHTLNGLQADVQIERDRLGVPRLNAANRLDLARATGFLHAQDRFFQMDLMRRKAAGELAAAFGPVALPSDRAVRVHRFRDRARRVLLSADPRLKSLIQAYAEGVNAGLDALDAPPPEYLALRARPRLWEPEDCLLVLFAMYLDLQQSNHRRESMLGVMHDTLPEALVEFLVPPGTEWDAPIVGGRLPEPPMPGPDIVDLRVQRNAAAAGHKGPPRGAEDEFAVPLGSNNWAVSGTHAAGAGALLANDIHLGLGLPNIWYRASFMWNGAQGEELRSTGITLPGVPAMVAGSNGNLAWGFTNSYVDCSDLVILEVDAEDEELYATPDGPRRFERAQEIIDVKNGEPETLEVTETIWGPVVGHDHVGRPRALRWVAHDVEAVNLELLDLEDAQDVDQALDVATRCGIPAQNFVVADRTGRIAWTVIGVFPRRVGCSGRVPASWADGGCRWEGWLSAEEYPRVVDPPSGRIWTANNRVADPVTLRHVGDAGYDLGARAGQIRDDLFALDVATPADFLEIQLDDRALFLERWRAFLLELLTPQALAADPRREELRQLIDQDWSGRAVPESVGYRLVRAYRLFLAEQVFDAITAPCREADEQFRYQAVARWEGPLWKLAQHRPAHLLDPEYSDWSEQLLAAVDRTLEYFEDDAGTPLEQRTWGSRNTVRIQHPLSLAVPHLSRWLDIPPQALPGDSNMPRVQSVRFGASERMIVAPGNETEGLFHMPGGQSGHPLSPYYRAGHAAWARGEPTPFLPGEPVHRLTLRPAH
jgi:penicillin amidase